MEYIQISIDGILYGSSYSLIALGFSLVFGVMRRINLAYGSSLLLGVAIALWVENKLNTSIIFFIPIVLFFCSLSNLYVERFCFAPHNTKAGVVVSMISSFAIWMQLDEISSQLLPDRTHSFPSLEISTFEFGGLFFRGDQILNIFIAFIISAILFLAVYKTKYGIILRAVSNSADTAKLMGCNTKLVNSLTFMVAGVLGGIAAFLVLSTESQVTPLFGFWCTVKGLVAMMIGGLGSLTGAFWGGLLLGLLEAHFSYHFGPVFREITTFSILLIVLIIRPGGLMGVNIYKDLKSRDERI